MFLATYIALNLKRDFTSLTCGILLGISQKLMNNEKLKNEKVRRKA
jgi:hypothetical protein